MRQRKQEEATSYRFETAVSVWPQLAAVPDSVRTALTAELARRAYEAAQARGSIENEPSINHGLADFELSGWRIYYEVSVSRRVLALVKVVRLQT
jgi:hypothetical protein